MLAIIFLISRHITGILYQFIHRLLTFLNVVSGKQRLTLNFEIPAGQSMRLGIGTTGSFLYRNRANTSYPYDIGDLITIVLNFR